jgi:hypothetical protein
VQGSLDDSLTIAATIASVVVAVALQAQTDQPVHITVKVTDQSGTVIPGARIQIDRPYGETIIDATTGRDGEAAVDLSPGDHVVAITATGFARLVWKIHSKNGSDQTIVASMHVADTPRQIIVVEEDKEAEIPLEHKTFAADIPLIPTREFPPPSRRLRHRFHWS